MAKLIRAEDQIEVPDRLPVIALRDIVFFPYSVLPLLIGRSRSVTALHEASLDRDLILLVTQRDPAIDDPGSGDLFRVGTIARILQVTPLPDGTSRVVLEGLGRARIRRLTTTTNALRATVELLTGREVEPEGEVPAKALSLTRTVTSLYAEYARLHERVPEELSGILSDEGDRVRFIHLVAGHLILPALEKQELLETTDLIEQLDILHQLLTRELEIMRIEAKLDRQIQLQLTEERKPNFALGLGGIRKDSAQEDLHEWKEIEKAIHEADLPPHALDQANKELSRLKKLNPVAPEAAVIRTHLDWIVELPWATRSEDNLSVEHASQILESDHFGLIEVKERILDHVAVLSLVREMQGPILCLIGPPGVGKTSLGRSIALALGREFVRVSLGGVRDEAEIRGHRRTYVGALPGRVIQGMRRSGTTNPVFLLDEVDKLARDFHGDPGAALLEVLDPEQNRAFTDHYLELEYDLSDVLFITTANTLQGIPEPLRDRMEVIRIPGYLDTEKREIAMRFLWPKQIKRHGLTEEEVVLSPGAVHDVIERYTREAGVRELERRLSRIARKLARSVADGCTVSAVLEPQDLKELLGPRPYAPPDRDENSDRIGIANGLAWTAAGGAVLDVEVAVVMGTGNLRLTGTLGEVMKESAHAAVTYARSRSSLLGLNPQFHEKIDVHIHIPEGATPKDGPSAGITIAVALISALIDKPTRADVAMTGEITLRGRVLSVGGIKEKAVAALRGGIRRVILPAANASDLELLPEEVHDSVVFELVSTMDEVMDAVLVESPIKQHARTPASGLGLRYSHG
ncbi:MAG TPA: endopeptidase La [Gemmatimonadetes bacterium]|nr:endopeptidase La [Gemmatimonadota bacterium]